MALIIILSKLILYIGRFLKLGSGSTWPGEIALSLDKDFLKKTFQKNKLKTILIAGTNGKTTTASLIKFFLEKKGLKVIHNREGANLLNGAASTIIKYSDFNGRLRYDVAIFEVDENTLPLIVKEFAPTAVVLNNLFRDQLDRYGEVNTIALKWQKALKNLKNTKFFINADDPLLYYISRSFSGKVSYFGLDRDLMIGKEISHDVDSIYCPSCGKKLRYTKIAFSHLGEFRCPGCSIQSPKNLFSLKNIQTNLQGKYNLYNINASCLLVEELFSLPEIFIKKNLLDFLPVFGRQEKLVYRNRKITLLLGKNPAGFNQAIDVVLNQSKKVSLLLVLNDRVPDGRDVSWIWDVDFEKVTNLPIFVSGDRCYDMALRLKYCLDRPNQNYFSTFENLNVSINQLIDTTENEEIFILATYSAMLEVRRILLGRRLL